MLSRILSVWIVVFACLHASKGWAAGPFGFGLVLAHPTGLTGNYFFERDQSIAMALGWNRGDFRIHGDRLWYHRGLFQVDTLSIDVYLGLGLRWLQFENRYIKDETEIGIRGPIGLSYTFRKIPLQLFGELGPAIVLVDSSSFVIDVALGGRYYL